MVDLFIVFTILLYITAFFFLILAFLTHWALPLGPVFTTTGVHVGDANGPTRGGKVGCVGHTILARVGIRFGGTYSAGPKWPVAVAKMAVLKFKSCT